MSVTVNRIVALITFIAAVIGTATAMLLLLAIYHNIIIF